MSRSRLLSLAIAVIALGVCAWGVALDPNAGPLDLLFGTVVLAAFVTVLRLTGRAGRRALGERARARRLAGAPAEALVRRAVLEERARLAADIEGVVRKAAIEMDAGVEVALQEWDRDPTPALHAIEEQGQRAGVELRRLLGLLREADEDSEISPAAPVVATRIGGRDVAVGVAVAALTVAEYFAYGYEVEVAPPGVGTPFSLLMTALAAATIVLRRTAPGVGAAICGLLFAASIWLPPVTGGFWFLLTPAALVWTAMVRRTLLDAAGAIVLVAGAAAEAAVWEPFNLQIRLLVLAVAGVGGAAVAWSDARGTAAGARADRDAAALAAVADQAVRAERVAVARELHDVVSHGVGVMVMQAGAALALRSTEPSRARRALDLVRRTAADTLRELDRLVTVIGQGALGVPVAEPVQYDIEALVDRMRGAGLAVRLTLDHSISGDAVATVYRIVQESLTNVIRHAPGATVQVQVQKRPGGVTVEVIDEGPGPAEEARPGYGLVGIAERVHRLGGELAAGPGPDGAGFRVYARIPTLAVASA